MSKQLNPNLTIPIEGGYYAPIAGVEIVDSAIDGIVTVTYRDGRKVTGRKLTGEDAERFMRDAKAYSSQLERL